MRGDRRCFRPETQPWFGAATKLKRCDTSHTRHDVDTQPLGLRVVAAEMNGVALAKVLNLERWDSNDFGSERPQRVSKRTEVCRTRQSRKIHIPAEFSGAVRHARLTP